MIPTRYLLVQLVAYGLDFGCFIAILEATVAGPVAANVTAKILAGLFAFMAHRGYTFQVRAGGGIVSHALKYCVLLAFNVPISSTLLAGLLLVMKNAAAAKVLADAMSVGVTFLLTKHVVFARLRSTTDTSPRAFSRPPEP
jgi:putative flippase GtrA